MDSLTYPPRLGGMYAWLVWVLGVLFVILLFTMQTGYAVSSPFLQGSTHLKISEISLAASVYTWVFATFQFLGGALLDRLGLKKVLTASVGILALGIFVFANAHSFSMLILSQILLAVGSCTGFVGAGLIGELWFGPAKFSLMFGAVQAVVSLFSGFSQNVLNLILTNDNWRLVFNTFGIIGALLAILFFLFVRNRTKISKDLNKGSLIVGLVKSIYAVAKTGHIWLACISGGISFAVVLALGVLWLPKIMIAHGLSVSSSNIGTSFLWIGLAVGSVIIPRCSDIVKGRKVLMILTNILALLTLCLLLYVNTSNVVCLFAFSFFLGFASAGHMLAFSTAADVLPAQEVGSVSALVNGVMFVGSGVFIMIPALFSDNSLAKITNIHHMFTVFVVFLIVAVTVNLIIKDTYLHGLGDGT